MGDDVCSPLVIHLVDHDFDRASVVTHVMFDSLVSRCCASVVINVDEVLSVVEGYERKNGNNCAVKLACGVMASYLSSLRDLLPETAKEGLNVALEYRCGLCGVADL